MATGDVWELVVGTNQDSEKLINVFHYEELVPGTGDGALALRDAWIDMMLPVYRQVMSDQAAVESLRIRKVFPAPGGPRIYPVDEEGDIVDQALPPNSVVCLTFYSDPALGKKGRGRKYMSAYPETAHSDGIINDAMLTLYLGLGNIIVSGITDPNTATDFRAGIFGADSTFYDFDVVSVNTELRTLRSRRMRTP